MIQVTLHRTILLLIGIVIHGCSADETGKRSGAEFNRKVPKPLISGDDGDRLGDRDRDRDQDPDQDEDRNGTRNDNQGRSDSSCRNLQEQFRATTVANGSASVPILGNIKFSLDIDAQVNLRASANQGSVGVNANILKASPALAKGMAEKAIGAYRDPLQLELVPMKQQADLQGYEGLDCVVAAVRSVRNNSMEYRYDPPIPFLALPRRGSVQPVSRTFSNINATVIRHFESVAKPGVYPGSVTMQSSAKSVKMDFNFGNTIPSMFATPVAGIEYEFTGDQITAVNMKIFVSEGSVTELTLKKR